MKRSFFMSAQTRDEEGATIVTFAGALLILLAISALAVDIGYVLVVKSELQNTADAAALAAARYIGYTYEGMTWEEQQVYTFAGNEIVSRAQGVALKNKAGGRSVVINNEDVIIGKWDSGTHTLTDIGNLNKPNAVRVISRRDPSANTPIPTFFARLLNVNTVSVSALATAALTGDSTAEPGKLYIPVGISEKWFETGNCEQNIQFSPTGTLVGCAGWTAFSDTKVNDAMVRRLLDGLTPPATVQSPEVIAGTTIFNFTGGTLSDPTFDAFARLFNAMKVLNDGEMDADESDDTWTTRVIVYDKADCSNPNETLLIAGFATVTITSVIGPPAKTIDARVKCEYVSPGRGGGGDFQTLGSIPGLVQ